MMWDSESGRGNTMSMCMDVSKNSSRGRRQGHTGRLRKEGPAKAVSVVT